MKQQVNIHAVIGLSVNVQWHDKTLPLVLYAQTQEGYQHLLKISSAISIRQDDMLPWKWLEGYSAGCIALLSSDDLTDVDDWQAMVSALVQPMSKAVREIVTITSLCDCITCNFV